MYNLTVYTWLVPKEQNQVVIYAMPCHVMSCYSMSCYNNILNLSTHDSLCLKIETLILFRSILMLLSNLSQQRWRKMNLVSGEKIKMITSASITHTILENFFLKPAVVTRYKCKNTDGMHSSGWDFLLGLGDDYRYWNRRWRTWHYRWCSPSPVSISVIIPRTQQEISAVGMQSI